MSFISFIEHPLDTIVAWTSSPSESKPQEPVSELENNTVPMVPQKPAQLEDNTPPPTEEKSWFTKLGEEISNFVDDTKKWVENGFSSKAEAAQSEKKTEQTNEEKQAYEIATQAKLDELSKESSDSLMRRYNKVQSDNTLENKKALYSDLLQQGIQVGYWNNTEAANRLADLEANGFKDIDRSMAELYKQVINRKRDIEAGSAPGASEEAKKLKNFHTYQANLLQQLDKDASIAIANSDKTGFTKETYDQKLTELYNNRKYSEAEKGLSELVKSKVTEPQEAAQKTVADLQTTYTQEFKKITDGLAMLNLAKVRVGIKGSDYDLTQDKEQFEKLMKDPVKNEKEIKKLIEDTKQKVEASKTK